MVNRKPTTDLTAQDSTAGLLFLVGATETMTVAWQFKTHLDDNIDNSGLQIQPTQSFGPIVKL